MACFSVGHMFIDVMNSTDPVGSLRDTFVEVAHARAIDGRALFSAAAALW